MQFHLHWNKKPYVMNCWCVILASSYKYKVWRLSTRLDDWLRGIFLQRSAQLWHALLLLLTARRVLGGV